MDKTYTLASLGILSLLPSDRDSLVDEVAETNDWLRTQKASVPGQSTNRSCSCSRLLW